MNYRFILGAKPDDHTFLFDWVNTREATQTWATTDPQRVTHRFRYHNAAPLNDTYFELAINFLEYWEEKPNGKTRHFSWITDIPLSEDNLMPVMRAARARWRKEDCYPPVSYALF